MLLLERCYSAAAQMGVFMGSDITNNEFDAPAQS